MGRLLQIYRAKNTLSCDYIYRVIYIVLYISYINISCEEYGRICFNLYEESTNYFKFHRLDRFFFILKLFDIQIVCSRNKNMYSLIFSYILLFIKKKKCRCQTKLKRNMGVILTAFYLEGKTAPFEEDILYKGLKLSNKMSKTEKLQVNSIARGMQNAINGKKDITLLFYASKLEKVICVLK